MLGYFLTQLFRDGLMKAHQHRLFILTLLNTLTFFGIGCIATLIMPTTNNNINSIMPIAIKSASLAIVITALLSQWFKWVKPRKWAVFGATGLVSAGLAMTAAFAHTFSASQILAAQFTAIPILLIQLLWTVAVIGTCIGLAIGLLRLAFILSNHLYNAPKTNT